MKAAVCLVPHELGVDRQDPATLQAAAKQLTVDFAEPMYTSLLPSLDALFKPPKGHSNEYCFQVFDVNKRPPAHWLHSSLPLSEQGVTAGALLLVIPITCLTKFSARSIKNLDKEGFLVKQSIKSSKETGEKRRWIVLKENFLLYYGSQNDTVAAGIVPLEYYNVAPVTVSGKKGEGSAAFELTPTGTLSKSNVVYRFASDSDAEIKDWMRLIRDRTSNGVRKRVFGVPLAQLAARRGALVNDAVPLPLYKCVRFLDIRLRTEGLFRLSASGTAMESLRTAYDEGQDPDLTAIPGADPHTVAGLLKLFLREMPEPLLTFGLYEPLLRAVDPYVQAASQATRDIVVPQLRALLQTLPAVHRGVLSFLVAFLGRVAGEAAVNLMTASNLAVVFAPNILRPRDDETNVGVLVANSNHVNVVLQLLIEERTRIFDGMSATNVRSLSVAPSIAASTLAGTGLSPQAALAAAAEKPKLDQINVGDRVIALYEYTPAAPKELQLRKDDVLTVLSKLDSGWLQAEKGGQVGMIPITYVDIAPAAAPAPVATAATPVVVPIPVAKVATPKAKQLVRPPTALPSNIALPTVVPSRPPSAPSSTPTQLAAPPSLVPPPTLTTPTASSTPPSNPSSVPSSGSGSDRAVPAQVITFKPHASPLKKPPALTLRTSGTPPPNVAPSLSPNMRSTQPPLQPPPVTPLLPSVPPPPVATELPAPPVPPSTEDMAPVQNAPIPNMPLPLPPTAAPPPLVSPTSSPAQQAVAAAAAAAPLAPVAPAKKEAEPAMEPEPAAEEEPARPQSDDSDEKGNKEEDTASDRSGSGKEGAVSSVSSLNSSSGVSVSPPPSPKGPAPPRNPAGLLPNPAPPPTVAPSDNAPIRAPVSPPRSPRSPRPISMAPGARNLTQSAGAAAHHHGPSPVPHNFSVSTIRSAPAPPPALPVDVELLIQSMSSRIELLENSLALLGRRLAEETRQREQLEARLAASGILSPLDPDGPL